MPHNVRMAVLISALQWEYLDQNLASTFESHVVSESEQDFLHIILQNYKIKRQKFPQLLDCSKIISGQFPDYQTSFRIIRTVSGISGYWTVSKLST